MATRIAQITDIHLRYNIPGPPSLGARRGREMPTLLAAALNDLKSENIDGLVLTGDLVDAPRWLWKENFYFDDDFEWWKNRVEEDYHLIKNLLHDLPFPSWVLPGNHDYPPSFRRVFGGSWGPQNCGEYQLYGFADWPWRGSQGRRLQQERLLFDAALKNPAPQIHFQHYLVAPHIHVNYPYNYEEHNELLQRVRAASQIKALIQGHYHAGESISFPRKNSSPLDIITGKAFSDSPHFYTVYEFSDKNSAFTEKTILGEKTSTRPAVFLDRDGVLSAEPTYFAGPHNFNLLPGAGQALKKVAELGYALILVSNQTSIGLGYSTKDIVQWTFDQISRKLSQDQVHFDGIYYSEGAGNRAVLPEFNHQKNVKPDPGFLNAAAKHHHIDLNRSWFVGDRISDIECAQNAGVKPLLVKTGFGTQHAQMLGTRCPPCLSSLLDLPEYLIMAKH